MTPDSPTGIPAGQFPLSVIPAAFIAKWSKASLSERASYQQHFLDLCALVGHPTPAALDGAGESFAFEKGAAKQDGGDGFADVWKRGFFAIEYKGKHKNLGRAYDQLLQYREALENPPLLVVCDTDRIIIHTNFTGTAKRVHEITLENLDKPQSLKVLNSLFFEPERLRPGVTSQSITEEAAARLGEIALSLRDRGFPPQTVAQFIDRTVFCLFAEDTQLLPSKVFTSLLEKTRHDTSRFAKLLSQLFTAMAQGGDFGLETIRHFNGDLFTNTPALELNEAEIDRLHAAAQLDWATIDPSIFGTLFERSLDPDKRAQTGAHYTSREDIELLIEPVVIAPLRREWEEIRQIIDNLVRVGTKSGKTPPRPQTAADRKKAYKEANLFKHRFLDRLGHVTVLDPACGSGNFLFVTLQKLKDLEKEVCLYGSSEGLASDFLPQVVPWHFFGLELSPYAYDLAQMSIWIGYLQWSRDNGYALLDSPVLRKMTGFRCCDAILDRSNPDSPKIAVWPDAEFIVGNPPFLGGKMLRQNLGDDYVDSLFKAWGGAVPAEADLCCYWFELARRQIAMGRTRRAGLLATQGIRGGANREVLKRIKETGGIYFAISDREWVLDGANVHISMVGFDDGSEKTIFLDGHEAPIIHANLSSAADTTKAVRLPENLGISFMGDTKGGPFDIPEDLAKDMLTSRNPHGRPNSDVLKPWVNGLDVTRTPQGMWIIDFLPGTSEAQAALYERPFEFARQHVKPMRDLNKRAVYRERWWLHAEARPEMRASLVSCNRFIVTPTISKHRLFAWMPQPTIPDHQLIVFARADDFFFGVLHSRIHEVWSLAQGTQLEDRPRYTPTTCFETFPFPWAPATEQSQLDREQAEHYAAISAAAANLHKLRSEWQGDRTDKKRTLTNLYNSRPTWLANAHAALDAAVASGYGWGPDIEDAEILTQLLRLNSTRASIAS